MDIELLIVLIIVGAVIVGAVVVDGRRKKHKEAESAEEFNQDALDEMMDIRDTGGFDLNGVGLSRIIGDDDFTDLGEPLIATRDDEPVSSPTITAGNGGVQFSLANALKPGIFDLDDMTSFQTRGITLFMILPGPKEPLKSYKLMLDTAQHLASELNGQLVDNSRSVLTQQTIQHFSEQIQDFERRKLSKK